MARFPVNTMRKHVDMDDAVDTRPFVTVSCPTCETQKAYALPRSAYDIVVTATRDAELDARTEDEERYRRVTKACPEDHSLHFYFEW